MVIGVKNFRLTAFGLLLACCMVWNPAVAQRRAVRISGDVLAASVPVASLVTTLVLKDKEGLRQLIPGAATSLATTYFFKLLIEKERPDHSNRRSFPSAHSSVSFQAATFLQLRYGWKAGVPAYLVSTCVAWSRVYAKKHYIWDVVAGAAIGVGVGFMFTTRFAEDYQLTISPGLTHHNIPTLCASIRF